MDSIVVPWIEQDQIAQMHPGIIHCPLTRAYGQMPELSEIFYSCPIPHSNYTVDVKVHMLMPEMFPCIPDWHCDMVPRDPVTKELQPSKIDPSQKMFLWVSGPPLTEFMDGREVKPQEWVEFTQYDRHRCVASESHTWRLFIRLVPSVLLPPRDGDFVRKHSQVYLNANDFEW